MKFLCCFVVLLEILGILVLRVSSNCALDLPSGKLIEVGSGSLTIAEGDVWFSLFYFLLFLLLHLLLSIDDRENEFQLINRIVYCQ